MRATCMLLVVIYMYSCAKFIPVDSHSAIFKVFLASNILCNFVAEVCVCIEM